MEWRGRSDLLLPDAKMYKTEDYLNSGLHLPVRFVDVEDADFSGDRQYWVNSKLYADRAVDTLLDQYGREAKAKIVLDRWQMDEHDRSLFIMSTSLQ